MPQTAFGPLIEPGWAGGAQMPGAPDLGKTFLNAFQVGATINAKQQALENQLALYSLRAQQAEHDSKMTEARFGLAKDKMAWDMEKFQQTAEATRLHNEDVMQRGWAALENQKTLGDIRREREDRIQEKLSDANEATAGANQVIADMQREGINLGDPQFESEYLKRMVPWAAKSASVKTVQANMLNASNSRRDDNARAYEATKKNFDQDLGRTLGGGNVLNQNYDWFLNPDHLQKEKSGGFWGIGATETGRYLIPTTDSAGNVSQQPVDRKTLDDWKTRWQELQQMGRKIATPINRPDIGVRTAEPLPPNRADWQINHIYTSPSTGQAGRWDGTNFQPVGQ